MITQLETGDVSHENVDLPEEVEFAKEMVEKRVAFLRSERVEETQEQGAGGDADEGVCSISIDSIQFVFTCINCASSFFP